MILYVSALQILHRVVKEYEQMNIHQFADGYVEENLALYDFEYEAENGIDGSDSSDSDSGVDAIY